MIIRTEIVSIFNTKYGKGAPVHEEYDKVVNFQAGTLFATNVAEALSIEPTFDKLYNQLTELGIHCKWKMPLSGIGTPVNNEKEVEKNIQIFGTWQWLIETLLDVKDASGTLRYIVENNIMKDVFEQMKHLPERYI